DLELLRSQAFAALALSLPDGALQNTIMWYRVAEGTLRMIAPAASAKARALRRSPQVAIVVHAPDNSYDYLEIRGHAEVIADDAAARAELREIAKRYVGERAGAYVDGLSDEPRVMIRVTPERVRRHRSAPLPTT
ncbi:MAG TPA: TIGR03618 family F420-dependent PPOX class oxidoreductase, partial [Thermomicrobiales bacterium]|nr:TIGR03618 family F420-dependent PPOX class oxidoreductase [Thermomicrobiales bacterium]